MSTANAKTYTIKKKVTVNLKNLDLNGVLKNPNIALAKPKRKKESLKLPETLVKRIELNKNCLKRKSKEIVSKTLNIMTKVLNQSENKALFKHYSAKDTAKIIQQQDKAIPRYFAQYKDPYYTIRQSRIMGDN